MIAIIKQYCIMVFSHMYIRLSILYHYKYAVSVLTETYRRTAAR